MRCRECGTRWPLGPKLGGSGGAAPGQYLLVSLGLFAVAIVLGVFYLALAGWVFAFLGLCVLVMCLASCGYQEPTGLHNGCECPACGRRNWIRPWDF